MIESLGKSLTPQEVANYLGVQVRFVRQHYKELGGLRLGRRKIVFFEKVIESAIQAQRRQPQETLGGSGVAEREVSSGDLYYQESGNLLGARNVKKTCIVDSHGLFG